MPRKLTCTAPDGSTISRRTDRTYTHVVLVRFSEAVARRNAESWARQDAKMNYEYYFRTGETTAPDREAFYQERLARNLSAVDKRAAAGFYTEWGAFAWCGREDLARKQFDKAVAQGDYYSDVVIATVNTQEA